MYTIILKIVSVNHYLLFCQRHTATGPWLVLLSLPPSLFLSSFAPCSASLSPLPSLCYFLLWRQTFPEGDRRDSGSQEKQRQCKDHRMRKWSRQVGGRNKGVQEESLLLMKEHVKDTEKIKGSTLCLFPCTLELWWNQSRIMKRCEV